MLSLQNHLLCALRAAAHLPASSLHRLLSTATAQFVAACGLTPAQALKASKCIPYLKSRSNPDAVCAFLADIGLAKSDVAVAIARDSRLLCSKVDKTLTPRLDQLREIGLSPSQISRLITIVPAIFMQPAQISRLAFYVSFLGSYDKNSAILTVPGGPSVECSTAKAIELDAQWSENLEPSGRAVLGVHLLAYEQKHLPATIAAGASKKPRKIKVMAPSVAIEG